VPRPAVASTDFVQAYPAYTRRPTEKRSPGDLSLLVGSKLTIKMKATKPVRQALVRLVGMNEDIPMRRESPDGTLLIAGFDVPVKGLTGLSIHLTDDLGIQSKGETVYPVELVPDREPTVRVTWPDRKEELATQQARILVAFEAADDFGIDRVFLRYAIDTLENGAERTIELDLEKGNQPRSLRRRHEFNLAGVKPLITEGSIVDYWIEVWDGNNVTGPGKGISEHYRVKIVSEIEKKAELMSRGNELLGSIEAATEDQEKLNQNLGAMILEKK
jgi:hypothetical protein